MDKHAEDCKVLTCVPLSDTGVAVSGCDIGKGADQQVILEVAASQASTNMHPEGLPN